MSYILSIEIKGEDLTELKAVHSSILHMLGNIKVRDVDSRIKEVESD